MPLCNTFVSRYFPSCLIYICQLGKYRLRKVSIFPRVRNISHLRNSDFFYRENWASNMELCVKSHSGVYIWEQYPSSKLNTRTMPRQLLGQAWHLGHDPKLSRFPVSSFHLTSCFISPSSALTPEPSLSLLLLCEAGNQYKNSSPQGLPDSTTNMAL